MTRRGLILLATAGSAALMIAALGFQYLGQMPPCKLCYWQRYPHVAAIVIGLAALTLSANAGLSRIVAWLGATAALATAAVGLYHTGVERGWWEGPATCTSGPVAGLSTDDLLNQIMTAPLVRCDDVPWELLSLSMASWNALASLGLAAIWIAAARRA